MTPGVYDQLTANLPFARHTTPPSLDTAVVHGLYRQEANTHSKQKQGHVFTPYVDLSLKKASFFLGTL